MAIDDDLQSLLTKPRAFLEANALMIYGSNKGGSKVKNFVMQGTEKQGWTSAISGHVGPVPFFVMYDADGFNAQGSGPKSQPVSAHYVSMREFNKDTNSWETTDVTHYVLPNGAPPLMVTSKINGCTFGIGSNADGAQLVSHLRPPGGGADARLKLNSGTRAGFEGGQLDVSIMSSTEQNGTVIGIYKPGGWRFYAQRYQMFASTAVGTINDVISYKYE